MIPPSPGSYPSLSSTMAKCFMITLCFFLSALTHSTLASETRHFKWEVGYMFWSPDLVENVLIGINGQFPGPTIRAKAGDTIVVELTNKLHTEGVVIHWHGIRQFGTPWADGTASISQCAINPEETFVYRFKVERFGTPWADGTASISQCAINPEETFVYRFKFDRPGTYFYHGHYGMQRSAGLYGSLIVEVADGEKEPFHYDGELNMLLSDWWHDGILEQSVGLSSIPFRWIGEPQFGTPWADGTASISQCAINPEETFVYRFKVDWSPLIEARGQYNCSLAVHFSNGSSTMCEQRNRQCTPHILHVLPNKSYRLRIVSTTALSSLNLTIGNHEMVVVDGNYVQPVAVDDLDTYSGKSDSVLIITYQNPAMNYRVSVSVRGRHPGQTPPGLTILNYPPISPAWNDYAYSANKILAPMGSHKPPPRSDGRIFLINTQNEYNGYTKCAINNVSLVLPATPYLGSMNYHLENAFDSAMPPDNFPSDYNVMKPPMNANSSLGGGVYMLKFSDLIVPLMLFFRMRMP